MEQPYLNFTNQRRQMQTAFGGYNHTENCREGEFYGMSNASGDYYPTITNRKHRGKYEYPSSGMQAKALISKDALCYVSGTTLYISNEATPISMLTEDEKEKTLISMGAYILVFPDKRYINTEKYSDNGLIEAENTKSTSGEGAVTEIKATPCRRDGSTFTYAQGATPPENPENGQYWYDTSGEETTLKQYSTLDKIWANVPTAYIKLYASGINNGEVFKEGDGVTINIEVAQGATIDKGLANAIQGATIIQSTSPDEIVIVGILTNAVSLTSITVSRKMPEFDYIVESNNRLWCCRYGQDANGEVVNQIYASALGDFKNWNVFEGIASDSYFANLGSDGQFTGAAVVQGYPMFFKENCFHKVYGQDINNTQIISTVCNGIQKGSDKSVAIVNNILYYKGVNGVYAYDGSLPVMISDSLGDKHYYNAVAGAYDNKYYISMKDSESNLPLLFVYNTLNGMWHIEDNTAVKQFCRSGNELYFITSSDNDIHTVNGSGIIDQRPIQWYVESGLLGMNTANKKFVNRLNVRIAFDKGTFAHFFVKYDDNDNWEHLLSQEGYSMRSVNIPLRLHRCDHFRLKIAVDGDAKIFSISRDYTEGSTL